MPLPHVDNIMSCEFCTNKFEAKRPWQRFCSTICEERAGWRRRGSWYIKRGYLARNCEYCLKQYIPTSGRQRWCKTCVPDRSAQGRMRRYNIAVTDWPSICQLCKNSVPVVVDHAHTTNKVRGFICISCNIKLAAIDDIGWLELAMEYLNRAVS